MTVKSTDSVLSRHPSIQKPLQPVQSKYHQIFREQEALGSFRGYNPEQRIQANAQYAATLRRKISHCFSYSSFFIGGNQQDDERFKDIFKTIFASARGGIPWVDKASWDLAERFRGYSDVCFTYEVPLSEPIRYSGSGEYGSGGYTVTHTTHREPSAAFIQELKLLVEEKQGFKAAFLKLLRDNRHKLIDPLKLDWRDVSFATYLEKPWVYDSTGRLVRNPVGGDSNTFKFFPKYYFLKALSTIYSLNILF